MAVVESAGYGRALKYWYCRCSFKLPFQDGGCWYLRLCAIRHKRFFSFSICNSKFDLTSYHSICEALSVCACLVGLIDWACVRAVLLHLTVCRQFKVLPATLVHLTRACLLQGHSFIVLVPILYGCCYACIYIMWLYHYSTGSIATGTVEVAVASSDSGVERAKVRSPSAPIALLSEGYLLPRQIKMSS